MKYSYLIVDDEPMARKLVASHAAKIDGLLSAGECTNAMEASNILRSKLVDLIFLDIQMPEMSGLQFLHTLKNPPAVILTTAHRDFAPEAFDMSVLDYLLKPISFERFLKAVNKFFEQRVTKPILPVPESEVHTIYIKADRRIYKLSCTEILYLESLDNYVKVHLKDKVIVTRESISSLEAKLAVHQFVRIHRSFIVNVKSIKSLNGESVEVNGKELPFGRAFKKSALSQLGDMI